MRITAFLILLLMTVVLFAQPGGTHPVKPEGKPLEFNVVSFETPSFPFFDAQKAMVQSPYEPGTLISVGSAYTTAWNPVERVWTMEATGFDPSKKFSVTVEEPNKTKVVYSDVTKVLIKYNMYNTPDRVQVLYISNFERIGNFEHTNPLRVTVLN